MVNTSKLRETTIKRKHLLEIHEQPWCPLVIRTGALDCLRMVATIGAQYHSVVPVLQDSFNHAQSAQVIDLCSGGGGPWLSLYKKVTAANGAPLPVILTDLYPEKDAFARAEAISKGVVTGYPFMVDATQVPDDLVGFRTLFTAFHHFEPEAAQAILQNAVDSHQGIAIFEQTQRSVPAILFMFVLPLVALLVVPFVRPFSWTRLLFTYLIPAIPLVLCIDGIVSCLRTYTHAELKSMTNSLEQTQKQTNYSWQVGSVRSLLSPIPISYLIGFPTQSE